MNVLAPTQAIDYLKAQGKSFEFEEVAYQDSQTLTLQYMLYDPTVLAVLLYGGVRGGKTFTMCKAAVSTLELWPGANVLLARDTRVNLEATTLMTLWGEDFHGKPLLPYGIYNEKQHNQTKGIIDWPRNGYLAMMGLDTKQNIERVKSSQWSMVGLEEVTGIAFKIVKFIIETRMTHPVGPRKVLLTTNTDRGEDEVYRYFFEEHTCNPSKPCANCPRGVCQMRRILVDTLKNRANLPAQFIERAENLAITDPRYHAIYMQGQFANVTGSIFPMFNERIHVLDLPYGYEFPEDWPKVYGYDHGYGGGASCLLEARIAPDRTIIITNELYIEPDTDPDVKRTSDQLKELQVTYVQYADPSIYNKNTYKNNGQDLTSVQALFRDHGVIMERADNDVSGGIERMRTLLLPDPDHKCPVPGSMIEGLPGQPYLYVARIGGYNRGPNLCRQMKKYKNRETLRGEQNPEKWDPEKIDDHAVDPCRYIVNGQPLPAKYEPRQAPQGSSGWAKKLQLRKVKSNDPDALVESDDFRVV